MKVHERCQPRFKAQPRFRATYQKPPYQKAGTFQGAFITRSAKRRSTGVRKMDLRSLSRGRLGYSSSSCRSLACRSSTAMLGLFRSILGLPSTQAQRLSDEHQNRLIADCTNERLPERCKPRFSGVSKPTFHHKGRWYLLVPSIRPLTQNHPF